MRLSGTHISAFADASGDHNPLHTDPVFARRSPWGGPIVHGALLAIAALGRLDERELASLTGFEAVFRRPVAVDSPMPVDIGVRRDPAHGRLTARVEHAGQSAVVLTCALDARAHAAPVPGAGWQHLNHRPHLEALRALAARLGAARVPDRLLVCLATASWFAGTRVPGERGLLTSLAVRTTDARPATEALRARVIAEDERTGSVTAELEAAGPEGSAAIHVEAFRRRDVPMVTRESLAAHLVGHRRLDGARVAVVGGSRGLGAAIVGACALLGATVWAGHRRGEREVARLRDEFGPAVRAWRCDVADPTDTAAAAERLRAEAGWFDGIVLCASPPLRKAAQVPAALPEIVGHLEQSARLAVVPSVCLVPLLTPGTGWLAYVSSAAVAEPPPGWQHYITGKVAGEDHCRRLAAQRGLPLLLMRAPRMWTDLTDSPVARLGAHPTEAVAADLVAWAAAKPEARTTVVGPRTPTVGPCDG